MQSRTSKKAPRAKNFTTSEIQILVSEVKKRKHILFGRLRGPRLTQFHRDQAWEQVLTAVNAVAPVARKTAELKKKFKDLKNRTKTKANAYKRQVRKTGGGENEATPLTAAEELVLSFISPESTERIAGGIDTFRKTVVNDLVPLHHGLTASSSSELLLEIKEEIPEFTKYSPIENRLSSPNEIRLSPSPTEFLLEIKEEILEFTKSSPIESRLSSPNEIRLTPSPIIAQPSSSKPVAPAPVAKKYVKKRAKAAALDAIIKTTTLQEENNQVLKQLLNEFQGFRQQFDQLIQLKKRELELKQESSLSRKRRTC